MSALKAEAEEQKALWVEMSWEGGETNPVALAELRAKAAALNETANLNYEGLCLIHGQNPIVD